MNRSCRASQYIGMMFIGDFERGGLFTPRRGASGGLRCSQGVVVELGDVPKIERAIHCRLSLRSWISAAAFFQR